MAGERRSVTEAAAQPAAPTWRERLSIDARDRRQVMALAALLVVAVALRLATWNAIADGDHSRFVKVTLFAAAASAVVWLLVRVQTVPGRWVPLVCGAAVLLAGDAIHYVRLGHPITRGEPVTAVGVPLGDEQSVRRGWDVELNGGGQARFDSGGVLLQAGPGASAYLSARIPPVPDVTSSWWLPTGLADRERVERLAWRTAVQRTGDFFVVVESGRLLVQSVSYGAHITYPDERDQSRGHEVQLPALADGRAHDWLVVRDARQVALSFDGRQVWSAPQRGPLNQMRLGETKRDPMHGGSMRIEAASYDATLER